MTDAAILEPEAAVRPYHHGDLRRALTEAALRIVERDGLAALSLRAVAREAGVSPAAPYHHFKDKQELMMAVGAEGFARLSDIMLEAKAKAATPLAALAALGVGLTSVTLARTPALYTLMWDCSRSESGTPEEVDSEKHCYHLLESTIVEAGVASHDDPIRLKLAAIAMWTSAHGLAEMAGFDQFQPIKDALGGEAAFFEAVIGFQGQNCPG
jgi:AcrR family transcriptional regulator